MNNEQTNFPFGADFQDSLFVLLLSDHTFTYSVYKYIKPDYFSSEILKWAWTQVIKYNKEFALIPSFRVLKECTRMLDGNLRVLYHTSLENLEKKEITDEEWLRAQCLEFIRRNVFVQAFLTSRTLYNDNKFSQAVDTLMQKIDEINNVKISTVDREFFFSNLPTRMSDRLAQEGKSGAISTGIKWLDHILGGGLAPPELGTIIGEKNSGKSSFLLSFGVGAIRVSSKRVLHIVLEGSRNQIATRYDAAFANELCNEIKVGNISDEKYRDLLEEYRLYGDKLVIRAFTDSFDNSIVDVEAELRELKRSHGFVPDLLIIDYGDLLGARRHYDSEVLKQTAAFRDIQSLCSRGYACWTASQAQRPKSGCEDEVRWLRSSDISNSYEKIRISAAVASINATRLEKQAKMSRFLLEYYRDNEADQRCLLRTDFSTMNIREEPGLVSPSCPDLTAPEFGKSPTIQTNMFEKKKRKRG